MKSLINKSDLREMMCVRGYCVLGTYITDTLSIFDGAVKDKTNHYAGKAYTIGQHGFPRVEDFLFESQTETEIWF